MNQRLQELARQAGFYANPDVEKFEKFAELIVQECADIAKHHVMNISTYSDAEFVEKQILENFGVDR
jgi:hypothetical protein